MRKGLDKYVERAFQECGYSLLEDVNTIEDLKNYLKVKNDQLAEADQIISNMKDLIDDLNKDISALNSIIYQVKVERYKDLNPNTQVI